MSFSKLINNKNTMTYCLRNSYKNLQYLKTISSNDWTNSKRFYSLNTLKSNHSFVGQKLLINTTSFRSLSSLKTDSTLSFSPSVDPNIAKNVTESANSIDLSGFVVPEPPTPLLDTEVISQVMNRIEIPLTQLDLASNWSPIGWCLHGLELLHSYMPWCAGIAMATIIARTFMFPLVILAQRNAMKMNRILPEMQLLQEKSTNARLSGNSLEFAKYTQQLQELYAKNDVKPLKSLLVPLCQAPIFMTFFFTLRRMANLPVPSLQYEGIFWFTDLSIPDPFYILPVITCVSLWAALELGVESGLNSATSSPIMKAVIRGMPVITLLFVMNFPAAILTYWCTSNIISLIQVSILKQKAVRQYFKIPMPIKYTPDQLPKSQKTFITAVKESWDNSKITRKLEDRRRVDEITFKKSAIGPIKKTYKYDPTKVENKN